MSSGTNPSVWPESRRNVDLRFVELLDKVRRNRPGDDLDLLRHAYDFAAEQHKTQTRLSGEPFLSHPVEVAHLPAVWPRRRTAGGRSDQDQPAGPARAGSKASRKRPKDASGDGE